MYTSKRQQEYNGLLKTGMFFEFYPQLTGNWETDEAQWKIEYSNLQKLRRRLNKINTDKAQSDISDFLKWKNDMDKSLDSVFDIK